MDIRSIGNPVPVDVGEKSAPIVDTTSVAKPTAAPLETAAAVQQPGTIPDMAQVKQAVKNINKTLQDLSQSLEFSVDSDIHRTIVKVVDQQTKEVIRQIPTEEVVEIAKTLDQVQGLLFRQKA